MWNQIFGSRTNCSNFTKYPLWYAHYDGKPSFDDWQASKFAGWEKPTIKQFAGSVKICQFDVDDSFF